MNRTLKGGVSFTVLVEPDGITWVEIRREADDELMALVHWSCTTELLEGFVNRWLVDQLADLPPAHRSSSCSIAKRIVLLGTRLYERIGTVAGHLAGVGKSLESAGASYNKAVGSVESQLLTTARELPTLGISSAKAAAELQDADVTSRALAKPELVVPVEPHAA